MATTIDQKQTQRSNTLAQTLTAGSIAGVIGGAVFGVQMAVGGMLPMVASMIGSENVVIGFILHMIISAVIGGTYGFVAPRIPQGWSIAVVAGLVWGVIWWVLGALVIMPIVLGGSVLSIGDPQLMSLVGHLIFGIVMAAFYKLIMENS